MISHTHINVRGATWKFTWRKEIDTTVSKQILSLKNLETWQLYHAKNATSSTDNIFLGFLRKRNTLPLRTVSLKYSPFYDCPFSLVFHINCLFGKQWSDQTFSKFPNLAIAHVVIDTIQICSPNDAIFMILFPHSGNEEFIWCSNMEKVNIIPIFDKLTTCTMYGPPSVIQWCWACW